jgi:hypothetical protein
VPTEDTLSMTHVFSARDNEPLSSDGTLLHGKVQDALLEHLPAHDRSKMKTILNHFATETIKTFSPGTAADVAWREALPLLATRHSYVLNGILAVGCLHLSTLTSDASEKEEYQNIAAIQMNSGMTEYRSEVQNVTTSNAEALFAFSTTITTFVLCTAGIECRTALESLEETQLSEEHQQRIVSSSTQSICRIFRAIRGCLVILVPCYHHIRSGTFGPVVERDWWPPHVPITIEELGQDQKLRHLETMWSQPGKAYEYSFDCLRGALKSLRETFALISRLATCVFPGDSSSDNTFDWTAIMQWPTDLPLEFISLLEQRRMEAWVLVAHYALLLARVTIKINPWLDGLATNMFKTSALVIGADNWDWISWPAAVLGIDMECLSTTTTTA